MEELQNLYKLNNKNLANELQCLFTNRDSEGLKWESQHPFHAIFGYLEVGEIIYAEGISKKEKFDIYKQHPHFANANIYKGLNSIYVASDNLSGTKLKGSGTFIYNDILRLTKSGFNKSFWELPGFFYDEEISISLHKSRKRFRKIDNDKMTLTTVGIGQDFVVDDPKGRVEEWARGIVTSAIVFE